jgi:type II secretory pathway component PulJ
VLTGGTTWLLTRRLMLPIRCGLTLIAVIVAILLVSIVALHIIPDV